MYLNSILEKLLVQLSLNLWIRTINYMVTHWSLAGIHAPICERRDNALGTCLGCAQERLLPERSLPV